MNTQIANAPATQFPAAVTSPAQSNSVGRLDAIKQQLGLLGRAEATGMGSRRDAAIALTIGAFEGVLAEGDAEVCYDTYVTAMGKVASKKHIATSDASNSRTAQISKFRTFIKLGMLPEPIDGPDIMTRAIDACEQVVASEGKVLSPFEALRTVAATQLKTPDVALTDEQITAAVSKADPKAKDDIEKLVAQYKALRRLEETIPLAGVTRAIEDIAEAITEAGGEVPAITKAEKEELAFNTKYAEFAKARDARLAAEADKAFADLMADHAEADQAAE